MSDSPINHFFQMLGELSDRTDMEQEAFARAFERLVMEELTLEQLLTLRQVFERTNSAEEASFWKGLISAVGVMRHEAEHGPMCGIDHELG